VRTFFGVLRVRDAWGPEFLPQSGPHKGQKVRLPMRELYHGTTLHGAQVTRPSQRRLPTTYYHPSGPIGRVFAALRAAPERAPLLANVGIVGLGVGSLAAYAKSGEHFVFFEIDPEVVRIARDPSMFSFMKDCEGRADVVMGDGRLALAAEADATFGLLVVDAFGSDAVPVHLLTREAIAIALRKLRPGGLVAYHLSSEFFDLSPVVAEAAASLGTGGVYWDDRELSPLEVVTAKLPSRWAVIGDLGSIAVLRGADPWMPLDSRRQARGGPWLWTDQYSSPLAAIRAPAPVSVLAPQRD
jgi:spermidine synthase